MFDRSCDLFLFLYFHYPTPSFSTLCRESPLYIGHRVQSGWKKRLCNVRCLNCLQWKHYLRTVKRIKPIHICIQHMTPCLKPDQTECDLIPHVSRLDCDSDHCWASMDTCFVVHSGLFVDLCSRTVTRHCEPIDMLCFYCKGARGFWRSLFGISFSALTTDNVDKWTQIRGYEQMNKGGN